MRHAKNYVGKRYGMLTVTGQEQGSKMARCKCDCGKEVFVRISNLNRTMSCGCYRRDYSKIKGNKPYSTNMTGVRGVAYVGRQKKPYVAYISYHNQTHNLGSYRNLDDAVAARRKAEEQYFAKAIEKYDGYTLGVAKGI